MRMRIEAHEYANEADDDVPKPAQSLGTPVPRQKWTTAKYHSSQAAKPMEVHINSV